MLRTDKFFRLIYRVSRLFTQITGSLLLLGILWFSVDPPNLEIPSPIRMPFFYLPILGVAIFFLLPYKLGFGKRFFLIRLSSSIAISFCLMYMAIVMALPFLNKPFELILPLIYIFLAFTSPVSLYSFMKLRGTLLNVTTVIPNAAGGVTVSTPPTIPQGLEDALNIVSDPKRKIQ